MRQYPAGSARDQRAKLAARIAELTEVIRNCERCRVVRGERQAAEETREALLRPALEEIAAERGETKTRRVTYAAAVKEALVEAVGEPAANLLVKKARRTCSLCRRPGHWAKNCPDAHVHQQRKKDKVARREKRRGKERS